MFKNNRILALIPARGGSKGIKKKNIVELAGKPLISYTIEASLNSRYIDDTIVTTDSDEIASVAKQYGADVPFLRPKDLASDTSTTLDTVLHAISALECIGKYYDILILLQPTQPLRTFKDIDLAIETFFSNGEKSIVSISPVDDHPLLIRSISSRQELIPLLNANSTCRRQDMPEYYRVNGCIYINKINDLTSYTSFNDNKVPFLMEKSHSVDIDDYSDLALAEYYLKKLN